MGSVYVRLGLFGLVWVLFMGCLGTVWVCLGPV